jgi:hypothetical protein
MKYFLLLISMLLLLGCDFKKVEEGKTPPASAMKCGAGKCGASMFNSNSALDKKKKNMLSQMKDDDSRRDCVISATSTKKAYNCVRDKQTGKLTIEAKEKFVPKSSSMKGGSDMKCAAGKCGAVKIDTH